MSGVGAPMKRRRQNQISGQFGARLVEMLESPAYRVLSLSAHRVLSRIEIELAHHAGCENGALPITYDHFEEYGVDRHSIGPAIRELHALGFISVETGCAGNALYRTPSKYGLTYRAREGASGDGSHEWRRIESIEEAHRIAEAARKTPPENSRRRGGKRVTLSRKAESKNKNPVAEFTPISGESPHRNSKFPVGKMPTTSPMGEIVTTSISRGGTAELTNV